MSDLPRIPRRDLGTPADWLLRAQHNRALPDGAKLWPSVLATQALGEVRFTLLRIGWGDRGDLVPPGGADSLGDEIERAPKTGLRS